MGLFFPTCMGKMGTLKFLTDGLIPRPAGQDPSEACVGGGDQCLTLCTVQAKMEVIDERYIGDSFNPHRAGITIRGQRQRVVLNAFDNIIRQEARDTRSVQVYVATESSMSLISQLWKVR